MSIKKVKILLIIFIGIISIGLIYKYNINNKDIIDNKVENKIDNNIFSMYIENGNGEYVEYKNSDKFPVGYTLNSSKSFCIDYNGNEINNILSYNNGKISIKGVSTLSCSIYLDYNPIPSSFTFYLNNNLEYANSINVDAYLSWEDYDITHYCLTNVSGSGNCTWNEVSGNVVNTSHTLTEGEGEKTVYAYIKDAFGNISLEIFDTVIYDSNPPTLTVTTPTGTSSSSPTYVKASAYTVSGTATDSYGIESVTVNGTKVTLDANGAFSTNITLTEGVVTTVKVIATDKAGKSTTVTRYVSYDISAPKNSSIRINNSEYTNSTSVTLYLSSTGAKQMCISNTTSCSSWITYATSKSWTLTSGDGTKTVYAWFRDGAGNTTSSYVSDTINLDTVSPTVSGSAVNNNTSTPKISFSSNEAGTYCVNTSSTKSNMNSCVASGSISANSTIQTSTLTTSNTYYVHVRDAAGNYGISSSISITVTVPLQTQLTNNRPLGLSTTMEAGLYRFQGAHGSVNNYICFGTSDKATCTGNTDRYMYRIIGINSSGQVKLIKQTSIGKIPWYNVADTKRNWNQTTIYSKINGSSFYTNTTYVPTSWQSKIATYAWKYGDYVDSAYNWYKPSVIYAAENAWTSTVSAKIGLMYIHDYVYAYQSGGLDCFSHDSIKEYETCKNAWIFIKNCDSSFGTYEGTEYTMTHRGQAVSGVADYFSYDITNVGGMSYASYDFSSNTGEEVRPVFYLTSSVNYVSGTGTSTDPFIIS